MEIVQGGLYILFDQYFEDFPDPYLKQNKDDADPSTTVQKSIKQA